MFDKNDPRLTAYLLGEMSADEKVEFENEIADNPEVSDHLEQLKSASSALTATFTGESSVPAALSDRQRQAIVSGTVLPTAPEIDADSQPELPQSNSGMRWAIAGGIATIAALCLVALLFYPIPWDMQAGGQIAKVTGLDDSGYPNNVPTDEYTVAPIETNGAGDDGLTTDFANPETEEDLQDLTEVTAGHAVQGYRKELLKTESRVAGNNARSEQLATQSPQPSVIAGDVDELEEFGLSVESTTLLEFASEGEGPGKRGEQYDPIQENNFFRVVNQPKSTFSIDVDTASYSKIRQYLLDYQQRPSPHAVRIEEMINYFNYNYQPPTDDKPFSAAMEIAQCPWNAQHRLARIALKGKEIDLSERKSSNLVFLLDVSGSMNEENKLPLVKTGMKMLVDELCENDKVSIVVYAGAAGMVLPPTRGDKKAVIMDALDRLHAGGSTNGGAGIQLAYQTALDNFIKGGTNRVILCTDGDFNVGKTAKGDLADIAVANAKSGVYLSVLGFGMGNLNDPMLEEITNKGNGNYSFIDSKREARKVLVEQMTGTLITIAKDVKIQVEFNPNHVQAYRLIGYENRVMANRDFDDDKKDAGEIGAGHTVTAFYELIPAGEKNDVVEPKDKLRYQSNKATKQAKSNESVFLKLRYKDPESTESKLLEFAIEDKGTKFGEASKDFRFAAAVAGFGMVLRDSKFKGDINCDAILEIAGEAAADEEGNLTEYRQEFLDIVRKAKELGGR